MVRCQRLAQLRSYSVSACDDAWCPARNDYPSSVGCVWCILSARCIQIFVAAVEFIALAEPGAFPYVLLSLDVLMASSSSSLGWLPSFLGFVFSSSLLLGSSPSVHMIGVLVLVLLALVLLASSAAPAAATPVRVTNVHTSCSRHHLHTYRSPVSATMHHLHTNRSRVSATMNLHDRVTPELPRPE